MLNVLLIGYGEMASSLLLGIIESGHNVVGIYRWAKKEHCSIVANTKDYFNPDVLYSLIKKYNIKDISAPGVNSKSFIRQALQLQPDVILVGSWGEKLKKEVLILPKIASVNCHPSLLPEHRGSNPYFSTIRHGKQKTGITFHLMNEKFDAGEILLQKEVAISIDDTGGSLKQKCVYQARKAVKELLEGLDTGMFVPLAQDEEKASYFPRITPSDTTINWQEPAIQIHNKIRAIRPWAYCYTKYKNHFIKIGASSLKDINHYHEPGKIIEKENDRFIIATSDKSKVLELFNLSVYGPFSNLWSSLYINNLIKPGNFFENF